MSKRKPTQKPSKKSKSVCKHTGTAKRTRNVMRGSKSGYPADYMPPQWMGRRMKDKTHESRVDTVGKGSGRGYNHKVVCGKHQVDEFRQFKK